MEDYKARFVKEYNELLERTIKLDLIIDKYYDDVLDFEPDSPIELLEAQYHSMSAYLFILRERAEIENIKIK